MIAGLLLPIGLPRVGLLEGGWQLCLRADPWPAQQLGAVAGLVLPAWIAGAQQGAYGMAGDFRPLPLGSDADPQALLVFDVAAFDPRAFQVLRSALLAQWARRPAASGDADLTMSDEEDEDEDDDTAARHRLVEKLGGARLVLLPRGHAAVDFTLLPGAEARTEVSEYDLYPAPPPHPPFTLAWRQQQGRLRRCVVCFAQRVDAALLQRLEMQLESWVRLLVLGGFEQPTERPGQGLTRFGGTQVFEEDSAEIVLDRFEAAEGAWNMLIHLLARLARTDPIVSVAIH